MKYIKRKSAVKPITGSIVDTPNIDDKSKNTYSARIIEEQLANLLLRVYPIGSYYWSDDPTDPSELFGGTWERIKDKFIYALGDEGNVGDTGGSETHTLTVSEMPSHTHTQNAHNHTQAQHRHFLGYNSGTGGNSNCMYKSTASGATSYSDYQTPTINSTTATNQNTGGGQAHNNMPPYMKTYCWKRVDPNAKKMISFSIYLREYEAEEGMTFYEWVNSSYNTEGWESETSGDYVTNDTLSPGKTLYVNAPNGGGSYLLSSETIIADYVYSQYAEK